MKNRSRVYINVSIVLELITLVLFGAAVTGLKEAGSSELVSVERAAVGFLTFFAIVCGASAVAYAAASGAELKTGFMAGKRNLKLNCIYEVVTSGPTGAQYEKVEGFLYILRLQDGSLRAFHLDTNLPPIFKVVQDEDKPQEYQYVEYPEPARVSV